MLTGEVDFDSMTRANILVENFVLVKNKLSQMITFRATDGGLRQKFQSKKDEGKRTVRHPSARFFAQFLSNF